MHVTTRPEHASAATAGTGLFSVRSTRMLKPLQRLGAAAILATGAIHLQQLMVQDFRTVPVIRVLFVLNVVGSCVVGLGLIAPFDRVLTGRWPDAVIALLAAVGLIIALGSLVALYVSENGGLFGLSATRVSTPAVLAIVAEGAAALLLTPVLALAGSRVLRREDSRCRARGGDWP